MARSKSSGRWLKEHSQDPYVQASRHQGYRSRASYKLQELHRRDGLFRPGMLVVDLGAAPGGWSQVAAQEVGEQGRVVACDVLPLAPLPGVTFVQGDFTEEGVCERIVQELGGYQADLVISDMAPNMSGNAAVDQPRAMYLAELALDLGQQVLRPGGTLLVKVFQGEGFEDLLRALRAHFARVQSRKPEASRARSREIYQLCREFRGG